MVSAQLFRAPPPAEQHYSRLAAAMEDFFTGQATPWKIERSLLTTALMETFRQPMPTPASGLPLASDTRGRGLQRFRECFSVIA
jgi:hypothetical protein